MGQAKSVCVIIINIVILTNMNKKVGDDAGRDEVHNIEGRLMCFAGWWRILRSMQWWIHASAKAARGHVVLTWHYWCGASDRSFNKTGMGYSFASLTNTLYQPRRLDGALISNFEFTPSSHPFRRWCPSSLFVLMISISTSLYTLLPLFNDAFKK